ncbi:hypothetical protein [Streptococcus cristatus]|nr:hypothetical protein [Streptococcus cristatus]
MVNIMLISKPYFTKEFEKVRKPMEDSKLVSTSPEAKTAHLMSHTLSGL